MGEVYAGIHEKIALAAQEYFGLTRFVETGTYKGQTILWAMQHFERLVTIEIDPKLFREAEKLVDNSRKVLMIQGDSREWLPSVCRGLHNHPTLFWLDAHWTGEMQTPDPNGCPLLEEIEAINMNFYGTHVIMIDDYTTIERLKWADSDAIYKALESNKWQNRQVRVVDDIYFAAHRIPEGFESWKR